MTRRNELNVANSYQRVISATTGAVLTSLFMTPLDLVKTRMQSTFVSLSTTSPGPRYHHHQFIAAVDIDADCKSISRRGTLGSMVKIAKTDGVFGLWRGLTPTLVMSVPSTVIYYVGYEYIRNGVASIIPDPASPWIPVLSGSSARLVSASVISPIELVRTRMQAGHAGMGDILKGVRDMIGREGFGSLWRGLGPTLWRDVPFSAIYWVGYESIKPTLKFDFQTEAQSELVKSFVAGCLSGSMAACLTHPFDVFKTVQQISKATNAQPLSMLEVFRSVIEQNGWRGLYTGLVPRIAKVAPACGIMISTYEVGKHVFSSLES